MMGSSIKCGQKTTKVINKTLVSRNVSHDQMDSNGIFLDLLNQLESKERDGD